MNLLKDLNSRQREAVTSTEGRVKVIAGAGTGKTKALTYRYAYLVNEIGIDPANILCLTFTNKAASEMRQRISSLVHSGDYNDFVCTIDGFCVKVLRREIHRLGFPKRFRILDEDDSKSIAKSCLDDLGIKRSEKTVNEYLKSIAEYKRDTGYIASSMLPGIVITQEQKETDQPLAYISRQLKDYALDFQDIENFVIYILDNFPDARDYWQHQLNYIMVDEAQDCNNDNWMIIETLAAHHNNLFIVGDPDQCIYEWRGAKPGKFIEFKADTEVVLDENYRSTSHILDVANCIIANNKNRLEKNLFTLRGGGVPVTHFHGKNEAEEAEWVCNKIRALLVDGASPSDFAILYRSSYLSRSVEQELIAKKLPYTIWGGIRFFERKEIKDALSYLRLTVNPDDDISFRRVLNVPSRGLGKKFMSDLESESLVQGCSLYSALKSTKRLSDKPGAAQFLKILKEGAEYANGHSVSDTMDFLLDHSGLETMYREDQDEDRLENIDELVKSIVVYEESHDGLELSIDDYLQDIALYSNADYKKDKNTIRLMTIHQGKGLEFPYVFVIGVSEGIFPSMRTIREYKKNGEEEERRLMYVAVTRAKSMLFLTESEGYNMSTKMNKYPSRFLAEIDKSLYVTEGQMSEELWQGTRNLIHIIDEENGSSYSAQADSDNRDNPLSLGKRVRHKLFGSGVILSASKDNSSFVVRFKDGSERNLRAPFLLPDEEDLP